MNLMSKMLRAITGIMIMGATGQGALAAEPTAQIEYMSGRVLMSTGQGLNPMAMDDSVHAGDRLMIAKNGALTLRFPAQNCAISYAESTVIVVPAKAACHSGDYLAAAGSDFAMPANFGAASIYAGAAGSSFVPVAIGLGVEAAALGLAVNSNFLQSKPVSAP
jgi:hypothetical protein